MVFDGTRIILIILVCVMNRHARFIVLPVMRQGAVLLIMQLLRQ
jgi:hypothetical protein